MKERKYFKAIRWLVNVLSDSHGQALSQRNLFHQIIITIEQIRNFKNQKSSIQLIVDIQYRHELCIVESTIYRKNKLYRKYRCRVKNRIFISSVWKQKRNLILRTSSNQNNVQKTSYVFGLHKALAKTERVSRSGRISLDKNEKCCLQSLK